MDGSDKDRGAGDPASRLRAATTRSCRRRSEARDARAVIHRRGAELATRQHRRHGARALGYSAWRWPANQWQARTEFV